MTIRKNYPLKKLTTLSVGGPAKYFLAVKTEADLLRAMGFAKQKNLPWYMLGEGSNMVVSDKGYPGVIIQNQIQKFERRGNLVTVGAGNNLLKFILKLDKLGLSGMERMAGIPGTVGGAVYGCAGAYGQEIKDRLAAVRFFDGKKLKSFTAKQAGFGYRTSIFKKHKNWIITEASFTLNRTTAAKLVKISKDTMKLREIKYKPGLKCPGSFFKNLKASEIKVPAELGSSVVYGKLPAGVLLEKVGAKGRRQGSIRIARHHANLIYNPKNGRAADVKKLANKLKALVKNKFGIIIEEEVQYLGFNKT